MIGHNASWDTLVEGLFSVIREHETAPSYALTIKLSEEVGEFSEIMLHEMGFLKHKDKEWKDTPAEEAADIINVLIGALAVHYPEKSPAELSDELFLAVRKKGTKYARLLGAEDIPTG
jgi:hypothetical protein